MHSTGPPRMGETLAEEVARAEERDKRNSKVSSSGLHAGLILVFCFIPLGRIYSENKSDFSLLTPPHYTHTHTAQRYHIHAYTPHICTLITHMS